LALRFETQSNIAASGATAGVPGVCGCIEKRRKTFTYITYASEGHAFVLRDHRRNADQRELAFLGKYLKPTGATVVATNNIRQLEGKKE
jgi:hypothetical protein